jgi:anti-sigma regulatory factor (Ser/Thr protein kinase)
VRAAVDRIADECRMEEEERFDLKVAATEAVTNALKAGAGQGPVEVSIGYRDESVDIEVSAPTAFPAGWSAGERRLESEGGRGIPIMIALVDEVEFARTARGTRVRIRKRVAAAGEDRSSLGTDGWPF